MIAYKYTFKYYRKNHQMTVNKLILKIFNLNKIDCFIVFSTTYPANLFQKKDYKFELILLHFACVQQESLRILILPKNNLKTL